MELLTYSAFKKFDIAVSHYKTRKRIDVEMNWLLKIPITGSKSGEKIAIILFLGINEFPKVRKTYMAFHFPPSTF